MNLLALALAATPNVLIVMLDDISQIELAAYSWRFPGADTIATPEIDSFATTATIFGHVSAQPLCSPTRASLLTGIHPFRHGIGNAITLGELGLDPDTPTLADWFADEGYHTALFGKWHLSDHSGGLSGPPHPWDHPGAVGFDTWRAIRNSGLSPGDGYFDWTRIDDGTASQEPEYATTAMVRAYLDWLDEPAEEPWFACLWLLAPHGPYHVPPASLLPPGYPTPVTDREKFEAAVIAADTEIGRALAATPENTIVLLMSDNGTAKQVAHPDQDPDHTKGSLYVDGIEVPFLLRAPGLGQGVVDTLTVAGVVDVGPALLTLAGFTPPSGLDGVASGSGMPYSERFQPIHPGGLSSSTNWRRMVRDDDHKLIRRWPNGFGGSETEELYDLSADPGEATPLPLSGSEYNALAAFLDAIETEAL